MDHLVNPMISSRKVRFQSPCYTTKQCGVSFEYDKSTFLATLPFHRFTLDLDTEIMDVAIKCTMDWKILSRLRIESKSLAGKRHRSQKRDTKCRNVDNVWFQ